MAIFHLSMTAIQRSAGRSAAASSAYRSGEAIPDPRQGKVWEYTNRLDRIQSRGLYVGGVVPNYTRQDLWSAVETHHNRKDACTAREIVVALPHELPPHRQSHLAMELGRIISQEYDVAVDVSVHRSEDGADGNIHAHLLCSTAVANPTAPILGRKAIRLDPHECGKSGQLKPADVLRPIWQELVNIELERAGRPERIDHRTLEDQGIDRVAQIHVGHPRQKGYKNRKERNDQIKAVNAELGALTAELSAVEAAPVAREPLPPAVVAVLADMVRDNGIEPRSGDGWAYATALARLDNQAAGVPGEPDPAHVTAIVAQAQMMAEVQSQRAQGRSGADRANFEPPRPRRDDFGR